MINHKVFNAHLMYREAPWDDQTMTLVKDIYAAYCQQKKDINKKWILIRANYKRKKNGKEKYIIYV